MGSVFAFVGIFLVSLLVAVMAALQLADSGLVRSAPEKDDDGKVLRWLVGRTLAPRDPTASQIRLSS